MASLNGNLKIDDISGRLKRASWSIGTRYEPWKYITLHYNGPAVKGFGNKQRELAQIVSDSVWHTRPGALGAAKGGDGLQYHTIVHSDGSYSQARPYSAILWHCGDYIGNMFSGSIHLPFGEGQEPTPMQLAALWALVEVMQETWHIPAYNVLGHMEWKPTLCPGALMPHLRAWRAQHNTAAIVWYKTTDNANIRLEPTTKSAIALAGKGIAQKGAVFAVSDLAEGQQLGASAVWLRRADDLGYIHSSIAKRADRL